MDHRSIRTTATDWIHWHLIRRHHTMHRTIPSTRPQTRRRCLSKPSVIHQHRWPVHTGPALDIRHKSLRRTKRIRPICSRSIWIAMLWIRLALVASPMAITQQTAQTTAIITIHQITTKTHPVTTHRTRISLENPLMTTWKSTLTNSYWRR